MTLPIPASVFADGELTNEASWYARIFTAINTIYARVTANTAAIPAVGTVSGTTDTSGYLTVTHGLGFTPSNVFAQSTAPTGGAVLIYATDTYTSTTFRIRFGSSTGAITSATACAARWMAFR